MEHALLLPGLLLLLLPIALLPRPCAAAVVGVFSDATCADASKLATFPAWSNLCLGTSTPDAPGSPPSNGLGDFDSWEAVAAYVEANGNYAGLPPKGGLQISSYGLSACGPGAIALDLWTSAPVRAGVTPSTFEIDLQGGTYGFCPSAQQRPDASLIITSTGCTKAPLGGALALAGTTTAPGGVSYLRLLDDKCETRAPVYMLQWSCLAWQCPSVCNSGWAVHAQTYIADGACAPARVPGFTPGAGPLFMQNAAVNAQATYSSNFGGQLLVSWFAAPATTCEPGSILTKWGGAPLQCSPLAMGAGRINTYPAFPYLTAITAPTPTSKPSASPAPGGVTGGSLTASGAATTTAAVSLTIGLSTLVAVALSAQL
jgi:hypothetical protein